MLNSYIICGTPRTGSTLLCDLLEKTGRAGLPDSFYGRAFRDEWAKEWGLPGRDKMDAAAYEKVYLDAAIARGKGETPVFGLRLMRENVEDLSMALNLVYPGFATDVARFERAFGAVLYIHLSRADKLAQAVSYIKARQTGLWHVAPDGKEIERLGAPGESRYDFRQIEAEVEKLEAYDAGWETWFAEQGIIPHRVGYEAMTLDPAAVVIGICAELGVQPPPRTEIVPGVARLSDRTNEEWMSRYRAGDRG
jgi:LPS sulfotransferase NodH